MEFIRITGEHGIRQDLAAINPKFREAVEYQNNCGNCAAAYAMRRQGFDVEARAGSEEGMSFEDLAGMFDGVSIQHSEMSAASGAARELVSKVERDILAWGEGANGAIRGHWEGWPESEAGHFFSVEVSGGEVMFVDGQSNEDDVKIYLEAMVPSSIVYGRLDNLKPNDNVKNAVKNRR